MINKKIVPALKFRFLTRYYDFLVSITTKESYLRKVMLDQINIKPNSLILDIACGTGSFLKLIDNSIENCQLIGLDADAEIIKSAESKGILKAKFVNAYSTSLPFENNSIDCITTSLFFHHLTDRMKTKSLKEIKRVLKNDGKFIFCDWDKPQSIRECIGFFIVRLLDGFNITRASNNGSLEDILLQIFPDLKKIDSFSVPLGRISIWSK